MEKHKNKGRIRKTKGRGEKEREGSREGKNNRKTTFCRFKQFFQSFSYI